MQPQDILGLILARGGSKRLPRKNVLPVNGKPLLAYTCDAATGSEFITRIVVSTDDDEITVAAKKYGAEVLSRPAELARDETLSIDVVHHVLRELQKTEGYKPSLVILLQPTSPLRTSSHIDEGIRLLEEFNADSIVSVVEIPQGATAPMPFRIVDAKLRPADAGLLVNEKLYKRNGAVYVLRADRVLSSKDPYGESRALVMTPEESVDIDTASDLTQVEFVLRKRE